MGVPIDFRLLRALRAHDSLHGLKVNCQIFLLKNFSIITTACNPMNLDFLFAFLKNNLAVFNFQTYLCLIFDTYAVPTYLFISFDCYQF